MNIYGHAAIKIKKELWEQTQWQFNSGCPQMIKIVSYFFNAIAMRIISAVPHVHNHPSTLVVKQIESVELLT